jgi:hypothetical protein
LLSKTTSINAQIKIALFGYVLQDFHSLLIIVLKLIGLTVNLVSYHHQQRHSFNENVSFWQTRRIVTVYRCNMDFWLSNWYKLIDDDPSQFRVMDKTHNWLGSVTNISSWACAKQPVLKALLWTGSKQKFAENKRIDPQCI